MGLLPSKLGLNNITVGKESNQLPLISLASFSKLDF